MYEKQMTAQQVIDAIHASRETGDKHGLENTRALLYELPPYTRKTVHVAGTNGKGSVCAMLESVLRHAGLRTGLYTSPFLQSYHERVRLNGVPLTDEQLVRYGVPVLEASARLAERGIHATPFEHGTALAFSAFEGEQVDIAVCEVGLGGRLDPTNVLNPAVCAITAIGMDHMSILGDTITAIAGEKAGIMKSGVPVVCEPAAPDVVAVFAAHAQIVGAPLRQLDEDMLLSSACDAHGSGASYRLENAWDDLRIALPGEHQLMNAMTVLGVVEELRKQGIQIPDEAVCKGLANTIWPARLEWCGDLLLDGAHNAHGISALSRFVNEHLADVPRILFTGVLAEKLSDEMLAGIRSLADEAVTVTPDNHRAMASAEYAAHLESLGMKVHAAASLEEGLALARKLREERGGIIIACGSLYFAGELRGLLDLPWR